MHREPSKVHHVTLSNSVKMPIFGLGTSHNGGYSHDAVVHALKNCHYRLIDSAKRYGCEGYIHEAICESQVPREDIFLVTKCWPTDYGNASLQQAFKGSCARLGTNYIDLYLLHWPEVLSGYNQKEILQETWRALEVLYDAEMVKSIGVSNFLEEHLEMILDNCSVIPHVNQCEFHPWNNPKSLRAFCQKHKIQFEGYSPLANGCCLTDPTVLKIAEQVSRTPSQVILRWNIQQNVVCIPKSTSLSRLEENNKIFDFELSAEAMECLNNFPQNFTAIDRSQIQTKIDTPTPDGYKLQFISLPPSLKKL